MFAVPSSHEHAGSLCNEPKYQRRIAVAAYNSPSLVILPRYEDAIDEVKTQLGQKEVFAWDLEIDKAHHLYHMQPCTNAQL